MHVHSVFSHRCKKLMRNIGDIDDIDNIQDIQVASTTALIITQRRLDTVPAVYVGKKIQQGNIAMYNTGRFCEIHVSAAKGSRKVQGHGWQEMHGIFPTDFVGTFLGSCVNM